MPIKYKKILVTADELSFEPGTILGLATGQKNRLAGQVKQLSNGAGPLKGEYELILGTSFKKGEALWVDEKCLSGSGDGSFKLVPMAQSYQELLAPTPASTSITLGGAPA